MIPETKIVKIGKIRPNPENPRTIRDDRFAKLVKSIQDFPEMLNLRPIVVDADGMILGGNKRFEAAKKAGLKELPVIYAESLTDEQKKEFIIKDNVGFGDWDFEDLQANWDVSLLEDWGIEFPDFEADPDYSSQNKEVDINGMEKQFSISFTYDAETFHRVTQFISGIAEKPEEALLMLIENYGK